jgi:hypothetical protein
MPVPGAVHSIKRRHTPFAVKNAELVASAYVFGVR